MCYKLSSIVLVSFSLFVSISFAKEQDRKIKTELVLQPLRLVDNTCYYKNQSYSRGALISTKVNNKTVQLKCALINDFELNGAVGWVKLANENKQNNKITISRE